MSNVSGLQLINGQDLIGVVEGLDDRGCETIRLSKPAAIAMMPGSSGNQMSVGLLPWIPFADEDAFDIPRRNILVTYTPSTDLLNNYNRLFGSGIVLARNMP